MSDNLPMVSPQIIDSVDQVNYAAFGLFKEAPPKAIDMAQDMASQKVAQATALAIQDATDYQRNMMAVLTAAQGKYFELMFSDPEKYAGENGTKYGSILTEVNNTMTNVLATFETVGENAGRTLNNFRSPQKSETATTTQKTSGESGEASGKEQSSSSTNAS